MRKYNLKILILFLSIALVLSMNSCDFMTKKAKAKTSSATNSEVSKQLPVKSPAADNTKGNSVLADSIDPKADPKVDSPKKSTSFIYTRENPFLPLISDQQPNTKQVAQKVVEEKEKKPEPVKIEKPPREVTISLNGVISGDTAFFSEDGSSRSLSVGDTISGMKILEINKGEVILNKDNMRYKIRTGEHIKIKIPQ